MTVKDELKNKLPEYLQQYHHIKNPHKHFTCINPDHQDSTPSMILNKKGSGLICYGCGAKYDIFDLIGQDYNIKDFSERYKKACELYGYAYRAEDFSQEKKQDQKEPEKRDFSEYIAKCKGQDIEAAPYLHGRGISLKTARRFNIGFDPCFTEHIEDKEKAKQIKEYYKTVATGGNNAAVIIPNDNNSITARFIDNKNMRYTKAGNGIFNMKAIEQGGPVFITEGAFDALSFEDLGFSAIALNSTNNAAFFADQIKGLTLFSPLIIALDNDEAGKKAAEQLQDLLNKQGINNYIAGDLYGIYKDANAYLTADRSGFNAAITAYIEKLDAGMLKEYQDSKSAAAFMDDFREIMNRSGRPFISTGFSYLDRELDGGLYEGLYIVGAVSSLGKTTYCLQIADNIAQQGADVIIFSLEMSRAELIAKSISRLTAIYSLRDKTILNNTASTVRTITVKEKRDNARQIQRDYINAALSEYAAGPGKHLYIYEAAGIISTADIRETIKEHINATKTRPVVIIDYLQILQPENNSRNMTDKQQTDSTVTELKQISRDYKLPVIAISSFNRTSYKSAVDLQSFKESGAIEYASDVLIGLQFTGQTESTDQKAEKKKLQRDIEAVILKNRNGRTGAALQYTYFAPYNLFTEEAGEE